MRDGRIALVRLPAGGDRFAALEADLAHRIDQTLNRQRARRPDDEQRYRETLRVFIANLAMATMNRVDDGQWLSVSFAKADYHNIDLSPPAARNIRKALVALGLIEVIPGFHARDGKSKSFCTRIRPTARLKAIFEARGLRHSDLPKQPIELVRVTRPIGLLEVEPEDVAAGRDVLEAVNAVNGAADISLPDDAWLRVRSRHRIEPRKGRVRAGKAHLTHLVRIFSGDWSRGGRLYGAFWINLPKDERRHLTINGNPTVELDYKSLHPAILYAKASLRLDFDPYAVPGYDHVERDQGKRTFNRLLNSTSQHHIRFVKTDAAYFSSGNEFRAYVRALKAHLAPISTFFVTGADRLEGVHLQREDSELALSVIESMAEMGIPVLPVHDSFIVERGHEARLRFKMIESFKDKYGFDIEVYSN